MQENSDRHPTLFRVALDFLPAQASSVPSERAFSSSAETDALKRNSISPVNMERLQLLKYLIKRDRLNLTELLQLTEEELERLNRYQDEIAGFEFDLASGEAKDAGAVWKEQEGSVESEESGLWREDNF